MKHSPDAKPIIIAGLLSAGIFFIVLALKLGSFFLFTPSLPLLYVGLSKNTKCVFLGALLASALIASQHLGSALIFLLMIGLPAAYLAHVGISYRKNAWMPLGVALLHLTLAACAFMAAFTALLALSGTSLPTLLGDYIRMTLAPLQPEYSVQIEYLATRWTFMPLAITLWVWGVGLYMHAWIAGRMLEHKQRNIRPNMAITPFVMPSWMLSLLGICALASLIGSPTLEFLGKAVLLTLAMPYAFLGLSLAHANSQNWANRRFFLFILYLLIALLFWPAMCMSAYGLYHQVKTMKNSLPAGGNSTKR